MQGKELCLNHCFCCYRILIVFFCLFFVLPPDCFEINVSGKQGISIPMGLDNFLFENLLVVLVMFLLGESLSMFTE